MIEGQFYPRTTIQFEHANSFIRPFLSYAVFLSHFDGSNGATSFTDEYGNTMTAIGGANLSTTQAQFGDTSLALDGNDAVDITPSTASDFEFGTGDLTWSMWVYLAGTASMIFVDGRSANSNVYPIMFRQGPGGGNVLALNNGITTYLSGSTAITAGSWHHLEWCRAGGTSYLFLDGGLEASGADTNDFGIGTDRPRIGRRGYDANSGVAGYIDEILMLKGYALHTSAFTPPSAPY